MVLEDSFINFTLYHILHSPTVWLGFWATWWKVPVLSDYWVMHCTKWNSCVQHVLNAFSWEDGSTKESRMPWEVKPGKTFLVLITFQTRSKFMRYLYCVTDAYLLSDNIVGIVQCMCLRKQFIDRGIVTKPVNFLYIIHLALYVSNHV